MTAEDEDDSDSTKKKSSKKKSINKKTAEDILLENIPEINFSLEGDEFEKLEDLVEEVDISTKAKKLNDINITIPEEIKIKDLAEDKKIEVEEITTEDSKEDYTKSTPKDIYDLSSEYQNPYQTVYEESIESETYNKEIEYKEYSGQYDIKEFDPETGLIGKTKIDSIINELKGNWKKKGDKYLPYYFK